MIKKPEVHEGDIHITSEHDRRFYSITKITGNLHIADGINAAMPFLEEVTHQLFVGEKCTVRLVSLKTVGGWIRVMADSTLSVPDLALVGGDFLNRGKTIALPRGCQIKLGYKGNIKPFEALA